MTLPNMLGGLPSDRRMFFEQLRSMLESERSSFITLWRNLNDFILPVRGRFQTTDANRGDRRSPNLIDSTATLAARALAAGMVSGITSPARPWFRLTTPDPDLAEHGSVKQWLDVATQRMRWVLEQSNFYQKANAIYQDLGVFGTSALVELEDDHSVIRFQDIPVGSFAVANGPDDRPAILTRAFRMTVRQLVTEFGIGNVSEAVKGNWQSGRNTEAWYDVVHVVMKNADHEPGTLHPKHAKLWTSVHYEVGAPYSNAPKFLRESGFDEMPAFVPVWETTGEDVYGTNAPGIMALGDIRQLQAMERRGLQGLEKMVNPPMVAPTQMQSQRTSILPGDVSYVDERNGTPGFRPAHETNLALDKLEMKESAVRGRIDECFFKDLFQMMRFMDEQREGKQPVTAAEIYERHQEKLLVLGPVLEQLDQRLLDPMVHRTFNIMLRRGLIPPPPPDIHLGSLKIEYMSMMHQAQQATQMGGFNSLLSFAEQAAKLDPSVADKLNLDKMIDHVNASVGNPTDVIKTQEEVDQLRQARAQQQMKKEAIEQMGQEAQAAHKLSQAQTGGKNALTDVLNAVNQNLPGSPMGGPGMAGVPAGAGVQ